jgi:predicted ferric reductase
MICRMCARLFVKLECTVTEQQPYNPNFQKPCELLTLEIEIPTHAQLRSVGHGRYVYITSHVHPYRLLGSFQSHPYMIMWEEKKANGGPQILEILVHCRRNFSRTLSFRRREKPFDVTIRGPYGSAPNFDIYDKVCFIASGVGIAAHLLAIRHLITEHHARKVRARRIALI